MSSEYELYVIIKDAHKDLCERETAMDKLLEMGTEAAEETLINLANDGYLISELRDKALKYCIKFRRDGIFQR